MERWYIDEELTIFVPEGNTKTLEELLTKPLDVIYLTRRQVEREGDSQRNVGEYG